MSPAPPLRPRPSCQKVWSSHSRCAAPIFGPAHGWCDTDIINRADLGEPRAGPCIIEEYDSTCVVPPGSTANLDPFGNIVIDVRAPLPWTRPPEREQFDAPFNFVCRHAAGLRCRIASLAPPNTVQSHGTSKRERG